MDTAIEEHIVHSCQKQYRKTKQSDILLKCMLKWKINFQYSRHVEMQDERLPLKKVFY